MQSCAMDGWRRSRQLQPLQNRYVHGKQFFTQFCLLIFGPSKVNGAKYSVTAIFIIWLTKKMVVLKF